MSLQMLITDRTAQDVDRVKILKEKAWQDMTAEERTEWMSSMKGAYNYTDLNRVGLALAQVANTLAEYGYLSYTPTVRMWSGEDALNEKDLAQYFDNVALLRRAIPVWESTPNAPSNVDDFGADEANALEQILVDISQILDYMKAAWFFSGDLYSAEV